MNREADEKKDLDDKGLGQNKLLCSSSEVELPLCRLPDTPGRQISGYPTASGS